MTSLPRVVFTPGEPAGIGPDLCVLLAQKKIPCEWIAVCDPDLLERRARILKQPLQITQFDPGTPPGRHIPGQIKVIPIGLSVVEKVGTLNPRNAPYVVDSIDYATNQCLDSSCDALVTGPAHKGVINDANIPFSGHTEYIADITGGHPVMMLATPSLRVALATTHLPVAKISQAITQQRLMSVITILHRDLKLRFGLNRPKILICGLNPHAGEDGHLGREEIEVITPLVDKLCSQGLLLTGPLPADTLFTPKYLDSADAVLAMYHDQGLPVLKYSGFGKAVNITLGLPIIRTSVDHGTALDLAGSGQISTGSLEFAIETAIQMCRTETANKQN